MITQEFNTQLYAYKNFIFIKQDYKMLKALILKFDIQPSHHLRK